jgi:hypothetical protein
LHESTYDPQRAAQRTEFFGASIVKNLLVGRVESNASHDVTDFGAIHKTISAIPEVEQVKHVTNIYNKL